MNCITAERESCSPAGPAVTNLHRLLLLRKYGSEMLVNGGSTCVSLPCVEIPRWQRIAESLTARVRERYGLSVVCLFTLDHPVADGHGQQPFYEVMEVRKQDESAPEATDWLRLDSLSEHTFADEQDAAAIATAIAQIREAESDEKAGPFARPGWIENLLSWVRQETEGLGIRATGDLRQLNASPTFALLRFETEGPAVWFKAVGEPNLRELRISVALSRLFSGLVPTVVATHPAWHGWLTTEFPGSTLDGSTDESACERAAETLAEIQIASLGKVNLLLEAGCRDFRVSQLLALVDPFMEMISEQMAQQEKTQPPALSREQLATLGDKTKKVLSDWTELKIPDTLGHMDLNPGNIVCSADQCIFVDWAEAYIGPPLMTLEYLREHLHRVDPSNVRLDACLLRGYAKRWESLLSPALLAKARILTPFLSVFAYAAGLSEWRDAALLCQSGRAPYLRSLTRRMWREAQAFQRPAGKRVERHVRFNQKGVWD
jgi:Ser/Thr protein kinase RdoA (MazF antagonist)